MAKVVNFNTADTVITGAASTISIGVLNYGADWVKSQNSAKTATLTYKRSPIDAKSTIRYSSSDIANVYANTTVDPSYQLPNKRGTSILCQLTQIVTVTDDEDPSYRVDLPFEAHIVMRIPQTSLVPETTMFAVVQRAIGTLIDEQTSANPPEYRFTQLLRDAMVPDKL